MSSSATPLSNGHPQSQHPHLYYQVYSRGEAIHARHSFSTEDPYLGRVIARHISPPQTATSVKRFLCRQEQITDPNSTRLFLTTSSTAPLGEGGNEPLLCSNGPGSSSEQPLALVIDSQRSDYPNTASQGVGYHHQNSDQIPLSRPLSLSEPQSRFSSKTCLSCRFSFCGIFSSRSTPESTIAPMPPEAMSPAAIAEMMSKDHPYSMTTMKKYDGWPGYLPYKRGETLWADDLTEFDGRIRAINRKGKSGFVHRRDVEINES